MKAYIYILALLFTLFLSSSIVRSQSPTQVELVKYTLDYQFQDGIYLNFNQVKSNYPILEKNIVFNEKFELNDFATKINKSKNINYTNKEGAIISIPKNQIWGYSQNGTLYIRWNEDFYRIFSIAKFSNFIVNEEVYTSTFNDPFMISSYPYTSTMSMGRNTSNVIKQYILDFETGEVMDYNPQNLFRIMALDEELSQEYSNLRKRKKRQLMFMYLRKLNDKYPLYLPLR